jgi:hypothetical protein
MAASASSSALDHDPMRLARAARARTACAFRCCVCGAGCVPEVASSTTLASSPSESSTGKGVGAFTMTVNTPLSDPGCALAWWRGGGGGRMLPPSRGVVRLSSGNAGTLGSSLLSDPGCTRARWRSGGTGETCLSPRFGLGGVSGAGSVGSGPGEDCMRRRLSGRTRSSSTGPGFPSAVGAPACCVQ